MKQLITLLYEELDRLETCNDVESAQGLHDLKNKVGYSTALNDIRKYISEVNIEPIRLIK